MRPRTNAKKVKSRAKAKAKAKAKVQAEADENKPTFAVDESVAAAVPEKSTSFDALPEELQLKILRLALFEDAEEDVETKKNALRVETLKQPAVIPKRADEKPLYDDGYDPVPMGIWRVREAFVRLERRNPARDERLWAFYVREDSPDAIHGASRFLNRKAFLYKYPDDWSWRSSCDKYRWIVPRMRRAIEDFLRGCARGVSEDFVGGLMRLAHAGRVRESGRGVLPRRLVMAFVEPPGGLLPGGLHQGRDHAFAFQRARRGKSKFSTESSSSSVRPRRHQRRRLRRSAWRDIHRGASTRARMEGQRDEDDAHVEVRSSTAHDFGALRSRRANARAMASAWRDIETMKTTCTSRYALLRLSNTRETKSTATPRGATTARRDVLPRHP